MAPSSRYKSSLVAVTQTWGWARAGDAANNVSSNDRLSAKRCRDHEALRPLFTSPRFLRGEVDRVAVG